MARRAVVGTLGRATRFERVVGHPRSLAIGASVALVVVFILGVGLGSVWVPPLDTVAILLHRLFGIDLGVTWTPAAEAIVIDIRLPRVVSAVVVGAGLAVAGTTFQGLLRNPLADPYVLGTASGAALGAAVGVLLPFRFLFLEFGAVQILAFVGALAAVWLVIGLSRNGRSGPMATLLLTGYAVGSLLAAGLAMAMYVSGAQLRQIFDYLLGSFDAASWPRVATTAPIIALAAVAIGLRARSLNGFLLGEESAAYLGVDVVRERRILLVLASLLTAAAVSVSGLIGFIGLVAPHIVRLAVGPDARRVLPLSALVGAVLLTGSDLGARLLGEIPVGVVTALIGAPFFVVLLRRTSSGYEV
jgi:iron complex transport system permease protein